MIKKNCYIIDWDAILNFGMINIIISSLLLNEANKMLFFMNE